MNTTWMERAPYALIAGVLLLFSFSAFKMVMEPRNTERIEINYSYEMPRVKAEAPGFSFAGRKIVRKYVGFDEEVTESAPEKASAVGDPDKTVAPTSTVASKDAKAKGKEDKKTAKKDDKKNNKLAQKKKTQMSVVLNANSHEYNNKLSGFSEQKQAETEKGTLTIYPENHQQGRPGTIAATNEDEDKLSAQQWRAILFVQPNAANVAKFIDAYKKKQVEDSAFYQIANELYVDTASDRQKAGFEMYKATPSVKSFTVLLSHVQENTPEPQKTEIMVVLKSYGEVAKFGILNQLLYSAEARVVQTAQSLISQALAKLHNQTQSNGRGEIRSPGSAPVTAAAFGNFVAGLKRLVGSNNSSISATAQSLIDAIVALKGAA